MRCCQFVADQAARHPARLLCRGVGVSRSGYSAWRIRPPAARVQGDQHLVERSRLSQQRRRATDGSPRVQAELRATGQRCRRRRVARLLRQAGLRGVHGRRRRVRTTVPDPAASRAPDRVERAFAPAQIGAPDRRWLAASSDVATLAGWRSLAVVLDGFSRKVVGWAMADHLQTPLVVDALTMAIQARQPAAGLIHHRDHGCQYTAIACGRQLCEAGLLAAMGTVGDADDNAVAEACCSALKIERTDRRAWPTRAAARLAIFAYIEAWYTRRRRHSTLGYLSPVDFEALASGGATT